MTLVTGEGPTREDYVNVVSSDILNNVWRELGDRGGFDGWWDDIDDDIQEEIIAAVHGIIYEALDEVL